MSDLNVYQKEMLPVFNQALQDFVDSIFTDRDSELSQIFYYHLGLDKSTNKQGKRIRPFLALVCTEGAGGDWRLTLPAAVALELIHNFSLIHDDIEDNGEERRGKPAVWKKWGLAKGINSGDVMFSAAFSAIEQLSNDLPDEIAFKAAMLLSDTCLKLTTGQQADIGFQEQNSISIDQYEEMVEGKTAALLAASCQMGALVAKQNKQVQMNYGRFGETLGKAFQIYDDWLGIWGDESLTGKSASGDLVEGKKSLPVIIGLEKSKRFKERWVKGSIKESEAAQLSQWLQEDGIEEEVVKKYQIWTDMAMDALSGMKCSRDVKSTLEEFANKLLIRTH